jgi:hypothetical protein
MKKKPEACAKSFMYQCGIIIGIIRKLTMLSTIDDATLMKVASALGEEEAVRLIEHLKA